jgi:hypothetical protein
MRLFEDENEPALPQQGSGSYGLGFGSMSSGQGSYSSASSSSASFGNTGATLRPQVVIPNMDDDSDDEVMQATTRRPNPMRNNSFVGSITSPTTLRAPIPRSMNAIPVNAPSGQISLPPSPQMGSSPRLPNRPPSPPPASISPNLVTPTDHRFPADVQQYPISASPPTIVDRHISPPQPRSRSNTAPAHEPPSLASTSAAPNGVPMQSTSSAPAANGTVPSPPSSRPIGRRNRSGTTSDTNAPSIPLSNSASDRLHGRKVLLLCPTVRLRLLICND